jgi:E3 SUMO-protein ligase PIAS1
MADPWADFDVSTIPRSSLRYRILFDLAQSIRHQIRNNTVDRLKHIANGLNEQCSAHITKSGKKQDLIDRITARMDGWRRTGHSDKWIRARTVLTQVRDSGVCVVSISLPHRFRLTGVSDSYNRLGSLETASPSPSVYGSAPQSLNSYASSIPPGKLTITSPNGFSGGNSGGASIAKYDPYAPPRKVLSGGSASASAVPQNSKQTG